MKAWMRWICILPFVVLLILVRHFEAVLFYDPLLSFFKSGHLSQAIPDVEMGRFLLNTFFRYVLNTALSLVIIWILFPNNNILKLCALLYAVFFVILLLAYFILMQSDEIGEHLALFYVRRFLIQPIFLLIFIPAIFFQQKSEHSKP